MPYLWQKFYEFRHDLTNYYPTNEINMDNFHESYSSLDKYEKGIRNALKCDMENGNLFKRFEGEGCILEFRGLYQISRILTTNDFVKVSVNCKDNAVLSVSHSSTSEVKLDYFGTTQGAEKIILILANTIGEDKDEVWKYCRNCRVVVFCDPANLNSTAVQNTVAKFTTVNHLDKSKFLESPIRGNELSNNKQSRIFEQSRVVVQGRVLTMSNIFPDGTTMAEGLTGELLNKLLKGIELVVCEDCKIPENKSDYIERQICFIEEVDRKARANIYDGLNYFPEKDEDLRMRLSEQEFLRLINFKKVKSIYVFAESGMGKSQLLISLGNRCKNSLIIYLAFRTFVDLIGNLIGTRECSKTVVETVIFEILKCKTKCEEYFIDKWLNRVCWEGAKIELLLDGLDEVPSENFALALKAMEIIQQDFQSIRLWVTSTKPVNDQLNGLQFTVCTLPPFSIDDKLNFFDLAWRGKFEGLDEDKIKKLLLKYQETVLRRMTKDLTSYPLYCSMLADFYQSKLAELTDQQEITPGVHLCESQVKRKFAQMHREIYGIILNESDNNFRLQRGNYIQLHTHYAFLHSFSNVSKNNFMKPFAMQYLNEQDICRMGIIISTHPPAFTHISNAQFFIADFIIKVLERGQLDNMCSKETFDKLLCFGRPDENFSVYLRHYTWMFVDEYLGKLKDWTGLKWLETHEKERHHFALEKKYTDFLTAAIKKGLWNLAKLLHNLWINNGEFNGCSHVLELASIPVTQTDWLYGMSCQLSCENRYKLLIHCVNNGSYEFATHLVEDCFGTDVFERVAEMSESGGGIFHCILNRMRRGEITEPNRFVYETKMFIQFLRGSSEELKRDGNNFFEALGKIELKESSGITLEHISLLQRFLYEVMGVKRKKIDCCFKCEMEKEQKWKKVKF